MNPIVLTPKHHRSFLWTRASWLALAVSAPLFVASQASAQQACGDTTCPAGFSCQTQPGACPAIACADEECPPCNAPDEQYCVPAACETDAGCGEGMVCAEYTTPCDIAVPDAAECPPGVDCKAADPAFAPAPPPDCTPSTERLCTPRWQLPCETATDCGPGFACVERESCSSGSSGSSGSAPTPSDREPAKPSDSGAAPAAPLPNDPPVVSCEPTGHFACVMVETACATDANCAAGWTCRDNPEGVCWAGPNGERGCEPADPPKLCMPPYSDLPTHGGRATVDDSGEAAAPPAGNPSNAPSVPVSGSDANGSGTSGGCSMNPVPTPPTAFGIFAIGLAAAFGFARRIRFSKS